jgi:hypothetical protein
MVINWSSKIIPSHQYIYIQIMFAWVKPSFLNHFVVDCFNLQLLACWSFMSAVLIILLNRPKLMPRVYLATQHDKHDSSLFSILSIVHLFFNIFVCYFLIATGFFTVLWTLPSPDSSNSILAAGYLSILQKMLWMSPWFTIFSFQKGSTGNHEACNIHWMRCMHDLF